MISILIPPIRNEESNARKFIDYDKNKKIIYNNIYLDEFKIVIKMPLTGKEDCERDDIKIKKFDLEKYSYLLSY